MDNRGLILSSPFFYDILRARPRFSTTFRLQYQFVKAQPHSSFVFYATVIWHETIGTFATAFKSSTLGDTASVESQISLYHVVKGIHDKDCLVYP